MNKWIAGLALALAWESASAAQPATEEQWIKAANVAIEFAKSEFGMPIDLEVVAGSKLPGHTPIGIRSGEGRCTIVVSARDNPTADRVSSMVAPELVDLFLTGAAIHEVGHCHRRLNGFPHNERLLPVVSWIGPVRDWFVRRVLTEEAYADMTEVAWLARYHPQHFDAMLNEIVKVRTRFREPRHDTLPWLEIVRARGPQDDGKNLFAVADEHLSRYR